TLVDLAVAVVVATVAARLRLFVPRAVALGGARLPPARAAAALDRAGARAARGRARGRGEVVVGGSVAVVVDAVAGLFDGRDLTPARAPAADHAGLRAGLAGADVAAARLRRAGHAGAALVDHAVAVVVETVAEGLRRLVGRAVALDAGARHPAREAAGADAA